MELQELSPKHFRLRVFSVKEILGKLIHKDRGFAVVVLTYVLHVAVVSTGNNELLS